MRLLHHGKSWQEGFFLVWKDSVDFSEIPGYRNPALLTLPDLGAEPGESPSEE